MSATLPQVYLARHGETAWSRTGQHTGLTDLPLTEGGEESARQLKGALGGLHFDAVFTSPLIRARETAALAGFPDATIDSDLREWDYGDDEGLTTAQIQQTRPNWSLFRDGAPGGESLAQIAERADRVVQRLRTLARNADNHNAIVFGHGHFLRAVTARWLDQDVRDGRLLVLSTGTLSILGYDHDRTEPVIRLWNAWSTLDR